MSEKKELSLKDLDDVVGGTWSFEVGKYYNYCMHDQYGLAILGPYDGAIDAVEAGKSWCQTAHDNGYTGTRYRLSLKTATGWEDYAMTYYPQ